MDKRLIKFRVIGGNFDEELSHYKTNFGREHLDNVLKQKDHKRARRMGQANVDYKEIGIKRNSRGYVDPDKMPTLEKLRKVIGWKDTQMIIQKYEQGEMQLRHTDYMPGHDIAERKELYFKANEYKNLKYHRMLLMLHDRKPGQFMHLEDTIINNWKKGDMFYYNTRKYYHGAGNCGVEPRWILRITGTPTKKFEEIKKRKVIKL